MIKLENPEEILRAAKLLYEEGFEFELVMIGSKDIELMNFADELGLINTVVFFKGRNAIRANSKRDQVKFCFYFI